MSGREGGILHRGLLYGLRYHPWYVLTGWGRKPAIPGQGPQPQPEHAVALTAAIAELVRTVAEAPMAARDRLATCYRCRNSIMYLLDTVPDTGNAATMFERRIAALDIHHELSHSNPGARDHADNRVPEIRGLA